MLLILQIALGVILGLFGFTIIYVILMNSKLYLKIMDKITRIYINHLEDTINK